MAQYVCVDPEIGGLDLDYESGYLDDEQRKVFEAHLEVCLYCQEQQELSSKTSEALIKGKMGLLETRKEKALYHDFFFLNRTVRFSTYLAIFLVGMAYALVNDFIFRRNVSSVSYEVVILIVILVVIAPWISRCSFSKK